MIAATSQTSQNSSPLPNNQRGRPLARSNASMTARKSVTANANTQIRNNQALFFFVLFDLATTHDPDLGFGPCNNLPTAKIGILAASANNGGYSAQSMLLRPTTVAYPVAATPATTLAIAQPQ